MLDCISVASTCSAAETILASNVSFEGRIISQFRKRQHSSKKMEDFVRTPEGNPQSHTFYRNHYVALFIAMLKEKVPAMQFVTDDNRVLEIYDQAVASLDVHIVPNASDVSSLTGNSGDFPHNAGTNRNNGTRDHDENTSNGSSVSSILAGGEKLEAANVVLTLQANVPPVQRQGRDGNMPQTNRPS